MAATKKQGRKTPNKWLVVRRSKIHGNGCFARRDIPKGTRLIEYLGERISHKEADRRYENADVNDNHTFLFIADSKTVIDATRGGNEARWINHSCDGNCESQIERSRVFVDARRDIRKGDELGYDYQIGRDKADPPNVDEIYACRCGTAKCRGSMLWPPKRKKKAKKKAKAGKSVAKRAKRATQAGKSAAKRAKTATATQASKGKRQPAVTRRKKAKRSAGVRNTAGLGTGAKRKRA